MPMGPTTMMRNQLQLKGGTKGFYSSEEWAKSVEFWQGRQDRMHDRILYLKNKDTWIINRLAP